MGVKVKLEKCDLDAIVLEEEGEEGRIRVRGGLFLPGKVFISPYRAVKHGFVAVEGMDSVTFGGEPLVGTARLQDPRIVDAVAQAADWRADTNGNLVSDIERWNLLCVKLSEIPIPDYDDALKDLRERNISVADFI